MKFKYEFYKVTCLPFRLLRLHLPRHSSLKSSSQLRHRMQANFLEIHPQILYLGLQWLMEGLTAVPPTGLTLTPSTVSTSTSASMVGHRGFDATLDSLTTEKPSTAIKGATWQPATIHLIQIETGNRGIMVVRLLPNHYFVL